MRNKVNSIKNYIFRGIPKRHLWKHPIPFTLRLPRTLLQATYIQPLPDSSSCVQVLGNSKVVSACLWVQIPPYLQLWFWVKQCKYIFTVLNFKSPLFRRNTPCTSSESPELIINCIFFFFRQINHCDRQSFTCIFSFLVLWVLGWSRASKSCLHNLQKNLFHKKSFKSCLQLINATLLSCKHNLLKFIFITKIVLFPQSFGINKWR